MIPIPFPIPKLTLNAFALKLIIGIACALLLALLIHDRNRWKAKTSQYVQLLAGERAAHKATVSNYRLAARQARQADAANIARVEAEQSAINERTSHDYQSRIAAARAAAGRLRGEPGAGAGSGAGGDAPVPGLSAAAGGAAQAAGEDRLPGPDRRVDVREGRLGPGDALIATEQAIQLDELIRWVRAQSQLRVSDQPD